MELTVCSHCTYSHCKLAAGPGTVTQARQSKCYGIQHEFLKILSEVFKWKYTAPAADYRPTSQRTPVYPGLHTHSYLLTRSLHRSVPWALQGLGKHSLMSISQRLPASERHAKGQKEKEKKPWQLLALTLKYRNQTLSLSLPLPLSIPTLSLSLSLEPHPEDSNNNN